MDKDSGKSISKIHFGNILLTSFVTIAGSSILYAVLYPQSKILVKAKFLLPDLEYKFAPLILSEQLPDFLKYVGNCKALSRNLHEIPSLVSVISDSQRTLAADIFFRLQFNHVYFCQNYRWVSKQIARNNSFFTNCVLNQFGSEVMLGVVVKESPALAVFLATLP